MKKQKILALFMLMAVLGVGATAITSCNVQEEVSIQKFKVLGTENADYSLTGLKTEGYATGENVSFKVEIKTPGKIVGSLKVNGTTLIPTDSTYNFEMGTKDATVSVELVDEIKYLRANAKAEGVEAEISGVVTKIIMNQGNSFIAGFFVNDGSDQIYVYTNKTHNIEGIEEGNKVRIKGKALNYKKNETDKFFTFQLTDPVLVSKEDGKFEYDKTIEHKSSVLEIKELSISESHVGEIYTADCKIVLDSEKYGTFNFLAPDETYALPSYAQSAKTYEWLKEYDGQWKNVSFALFTPKISGGNAFWRVVPIAINGDYTQTDADKLGYYLNEANESFNKKYFSKTSIELLSTSQNNSNVKFEYESTNKEIADIEVKNQKPFLNIKGVSGKTSIKVTASIADGSASLSGEPIEIVVNTTAPTLELTTIKDIRTDKVADDQEINVKGIVVGGVYANGNDGSRFNSYYIMDNEDSTIVNLKPTEWSEMILEKGMEVTLTGKKDVYEDANNAVSIKDVEIKFISEGKHEWPFKPETKSFKELYDTAATAENNLAGKLYYVDVKLTAEFNKNSNQLQYYIEEIGAANPVKKNVYQASKTNVDSFLKEFKDKEIRCLLGIHDAKNGFYRYDIIPGTIELLK